ncbi:vomeronasal type-2 receptor 26-like [Protopterus annectens]|uniref:vomeronasal type-2 receptor 26-like n=1 Tax=Protopterus annectens TaxID=7888 RepID=UPI001CF9D31F|nr:vomeronasal type-2 receptor 26-like [Protopterus annectens]
MDYVNNIMNILYDTKKYTSVSLNEIHIAHRRLQLFLEDSLYQGVINEDTLNFLKNDFPLIPTAFGIAKVHKNVDNPLYRLIVAGQNSSTYPSGAFVYRLIKDVLGSVTQVIKDSWDFLTRIKSHFSSDTRGFSVIDIVDLFSLIPHEEGLELFHEALLAYLKLSNTMVNFVMELMEWILYNNFISFEDEYFKQVKDSNDCFTCTAAYWPNEQRDACIQKVIYFLAFDEPLGTTLAVLSTFIAFIPAAILLIFIRSKNTPIVKANNRELSYLLLFALILCFLCSLLFIGQPTTITCLLRQVIFGISFALCVSCVLAKTMMVIIAFRATNPNSNLRQWVGPRLPSIVVFTCTLLQVVICSAWLASTPPFPEHNMTSQNGIIILECNEGSNVAFWFMLSYMGLLAVASFAMAFLSRNLPDSFNEAKFITFSMLVFLSVWLSFIPAYLSTKGKFLVAVEIFAIISSSAGLLTCIFIPKCIIILLQPENNSRDYLMKRGNK